MRKLLPMSLLAALALSCGSDPVVDKAQFPTQIAQAVCRWYFACCDIAERGNLKMTAATELECVSQLSASYAMAYQSADATRWDGKQGLACVEKVQAASTSCPKAYDPASDVAACSMITPTAGPGYPCASNWECTTKFCKSGVCAVAIPAGYECKPDEPCAAGLRCIEGKCKALQPDGAACTFGTECYSGACGGGQCVNSPNYTCDGR